MKANTAARERNGRMDGRASEGMSITVTRRDGQTRTETVRRVLWTDGSTSLCAISGGQQHASSRRASAGGKHGPCANDCGRPGVVLAYDMSGLGGYCCRQCAHGPVEDRSFA